MNLPQFVNPIGYVVQYADDTTWFTHAQLFDDLLIVANRTTAAFVLKTSDGLVLFDAIYPKEEMFHAIIDGIRDIGWEPRDIRKFIITHGHMDHCGCGKWIVDYCGCETYLSEIDDIYWEQNPVLPDKPETWKNFKIDHYVSDGDEIRQGDTCIKVHFTPGHTPGGLSFSFPVHDNGEVHMAGMWGGTNPPPSIGGILQYFSSLDHFQEETARAHCDVILNNHPLLDGYEKIAYAQKRASHMPNNYIIGEENFQRFCKVYRIFCYDRLKEIDETLSRGSRSV